MNIVYKINAALKQFSTGDKKSAYKKLKKIFDKNKHNDLLRFNLAVVEQTLNLNKESKDNYLYLINKNNNIKAMINLYLLFLKEDNYPKALFFIDKIIQTNQYSISTIKDKAFVLYKLKYYDESIKICESYSNNNDPEFLNILGLNYLSKKNISKAEKIFKSGLLIDNQNPLILNSLGRMYHEKRDSINAEKYLVRANKIKNNSYEIINNLAGFYREETKYDKAIDLYKKALKINPNSPAIINNLAKVYFDIDNLDLAKKYCLKALSLNHEDGNIQKILSLIYLREQNYKKGWEYFDGRLNISDFEERNESIKIIRNKIPIKNKVNINSKVLILREQGVGDEILYGTMYSDLLQSFKDVTIECDKRLKKLFKNTFPKYKKSFVNLGKFSENSDSLSQYENIIYAGSLGKYFRNDIKEFRDGNYLRADKKLIDKSKKILENLDGKINIGISWKSFKNRYSGEKSLNLEDFLEIFKTENCNFINLQYGDVEREVIEFNKRYNQNIFTIDDLDLFENFDYLAAFLKNLDLFISVSNSTSHLAGALGVKTLLVKPINHALFHYWNQPDNKTPWYNSITLLDKNDVIHNIDLISKALDL